MARFSVILSIAVVAVVALYTKQVVAQNGVIAVDQTDEPGCAEPDASDCIGRAEVADCGANLCCSGLKYAAAADGSVWAIENGTCTCCTKGFCRTQAGGAIGTTDNTQSDAEAVDVQCKLPAV